MITENTKSNASTVPYNYTSISFKYRPDYEYVNTLILVVVFILCIFIYNKIQLYFKSNKR